LAETYTRSLETECDASFMPDSGLGGTGVILRDSGGNFIAACCDSNDHAIDVHSMEAAALLAGLQLADAIGCHSLSVESDSREVVETVLNPFEFGGTGAVIIDDCRQLLASLGMATIRHCPREANGVAHTLARHGASQGLGQVWLDVPPSFLILVLVDDHVIVQ
jgi:ribonuclease HI